MTYLIRTHFHARRYPTAVCRMATKLTNCWREGSTSTVIPPSSTSNVMG
jgi:hypothetical protein